MTLQLTSVLHADKAGFDAVIDVRSPGEFAVDHLPRAINLPVLDDVQRAEVGTIYNQVSAFDARKLGASLIAANAARHIAGPLASHGGGWRPLLYCWRGGMRSNALATILRQIGWRAEIVEGGYKAWRRLVVARVAEIPVRTPVWVLDGDTGSGKTAVLAALARRGMQVIDLEGLANHRGSLFGAMPGGQPGQALFEGRLAAALEALDPTRPVVVEAESSRIGERSLPKSIWQAVAGAPRLRLDVPLHERARFTAATYREITDTPGEVEAIVGRLAAAHPRERISEWREMATRGNWETLAEGLMQAHYDPRYARHRARYDDRVRETIAVPHLNVDGIEAAAASVERLVAAGAGATADLTSA